MPPRKRVSATQPTQDSGGEDFEDAFSDDAHARGKGKGRRSAAGGVLSEAEINKKAHQLCRLALFTEYRRLVLKKEDINKKVMGGNSRAFPQVLAAANKELKKAFGYEIVELSTREEREKNMLGVAEPNGEEDGKKKATKQYIVRSTLDPSLIALASAPDEEIRTQEENDALQVDEDIPFIGSILGWQINDAVASYGVMCVILALVLVNGKSVADATLRSLLKRLKLGSASMIDVGVMNAPKKIPLDAYLNLLLKQGYLDRVKVGNTQGQKSNKRGRGGAARADNEEGSVDWEWRWGERAHAEISEQGISNFIVDFMVERSKPDARDGAQENARQKKEREERATKQWTKDVMRAAQTPLTQIGGEEEA